jgi:hypothetical protein
MECLLTFYGARKVMSQIHYDSTWFSWQLVIKSQFCGVEKPLALLKVVRPTVVENVRYDYIGGHYVGGPCIGLVILPCGH